MAHRLRQLTRDSRIGNFRVRSQQVMAFLGTTAWLTTSAFDHFILRCISAAVR
jgi:hypothetical protein